MPAKKDSEKRKLIGARFDPEDRATVGKFAKEAGISPGAEVEKRVKATLAFDEEGLALIAEIGAEIREIQEGLGGSKPWHKNLKKWSAVTDMLRTGPIMDRNPDSPADDEAVKAAYSTVTDLQDERQAIIDEVAQHGLAWKSEPRSQTGKRGGGILGAFAILDTREGERALLNKLDDGPEKDALIQAHSKVVELDLKVSEAKGAWISLLSNYWDAEAEGRNWNRERQRVKAKAAWDRGEQVDFYRLSGQDPWNLKG
ncbi:DUF4062 domain-containing protein [Qipengyuania aquimaris]|uniref:DUF4062 domain-containing protein n=1 Tax=Qipengyuania aquimaris TaxID=255984 RepID=A0A9Q3S323_9SPHN|nr:DUF4062 domain-containing protein [Qipengyuania aquimaris]MBY6219021.1 DUF4062 domain-containing protein [Qipengyuania aquimaris]